MSSKRAVLLLNLGGPETLSDVRPFLFRLFADPEIIRIPFPPLRYFVAWLISTLREKKSQDLYRQIGGGSPIRKYTDLQSVGVEEGLRKKGKDVVVRTAFTCSDPLVEDVVKELAQNGVEHILSLPLYPQYSYTTTRSSLNRVQKAIRRFAPKAALHEIRCWQSHPMFLKAHAERIQEQVAQFSNPSSDQIHLLFSAHSIPEKLVTQEGDPYKDQMEETVKGVLRELNWKGPWSLAWQSRLGPVKWLEPATPDVIKKLGQEGVKQVLIDPIAFVSDHIETLCEIDIEFAELAKEAGIQEFRKAEGLNTLPTFINALVDLAESRKEFWN